MLLKLGFNKGEIFNNKEIFNSREIYSSKQIYNKETYNQLLNRDSLCNKEPNRDNFFIS